MHADKLEPGLPYPLGASFNGEGVNFAVYSAHAEFIELCLFEEGQESRLRLPEKTDEVWHGFLPGAAPGLAYGYRAHGPFEPDKGLRFNPHKLLLDPYATKLSGAVKWDESLLPYKPGEDDLSVDERDSAPFMAKGIVDVIDFRWGADTPPGVPWADTVIYEAHVKGLTKLFPGIPGRRRGTYAALGDPGVIRHLQRLGITAVELLPIYAFLQDKRLLDMSLRNYWGYNTLSYFCPEPSYAFGPDAGVELRGAIRKLHSAGIEVILDVVYNHTCEGNEMGPTLSWRGLDNISYYRLMPDDRRHYINDTGTGNTVNMSHPRTIQMVMDSLRHFVRSYHVDGFRFDLGATLGREDAGFDPGCGFFDALRQDPMLSRVKLISEPWDIGPGGYQLGNHPPGFSEWNDQYRDTVRRYWRGDPGQRPALAERIAGSSDYFGLRRPTASINFITSHDGATLADLVTYEGKYNQANGEDNRDGISDNIARNWGAEGPTDSLEINAIRHRVQRSMLMTLLCSLGAPMLLGGDEFGRTQHGNNNGYCQDNEISWFDWKQAASPDGDKLIDFTAELIRIRKEYPMLHVNAYVEDREIGNGLRTIAWYDERGQILAQEDWENAEGRALTLFRSDGHVALAMAMNGSENDLDFHLPNGLGWKLLLASAQDQPPLSSDTAKIPAHGCALFAGTLTPT